MTRIMMIAAAFTLPAAAALAQAATPAGPGALSGRSPVQAYRPAAAMTPACGHSMHSLPAGKLPTYGTHALPAAPCEKNQVASAEGEKRTARD